jgi:hypothetical protein
MAYSLVRFWRYVFVPLILAAITLFLFIVFFTSGTQLAIGALYKPYTIATSNPTT